MRVIHTEFAPSAKGTYSQGIEIGGVVYTAGQIGLDPATGKLEKEPERQIVRSFDNIRQICIASGGDCDSIVRLNVYLTDLKFWPTVNEVMDCYFTKPYPARTAIGVATLPFEAIIELDAIMVLSRP